jgi:hypothetical protein
VVVGEEGPGGVRSELFYSIATPDPVTDAKRRFEMAELAVRARPFHEIPETDRCEVSALGFALAPPEGEKCSLTTHHRIGDGWITITTDYETDDGPNVIVAAFFPSSGSFTYRCHHCEAGNPEVPRLVTAVVTFLTEGLAASESTGSTLGTEPPDARDGADSDPTGVIESLSEDADESALWAVIIGLIGTVSIGATRVAEDRMEREEGTLSEESAPGGDDAGISGTAEPDVRLSDGEIDDMIQWGLDNNRSPDDILRDVEALNEARGGSGPVELPVPLETIDTPGGPVTVTADDAETYRSAVSEIEVKGLQQDTLRRDLERLEGDAGQWAGAEQMAAERWAASLQDIAERARDMDAKRAEIEEALNALNRKPDAMVWDMVGTGLTSAEAHDSWLSRETHGWHHDEIQRLEQELSDAEQEFTDQMTRYRSDHDDRLTSLQDHLRTIEEGTSPPIREDFIDQPDPDAALFDALEAWRTRDTSGAYFDEAQRLRAEIAGLEEGSSISDVDPAREGDRGSVYDRPARELGGIAQEQERILEQYRQLDAEMEELQRTIDGIVGGSTSTGG